MAFGVRWDLGMAKGTHASVCTALACCPSTCWRGWCCCCCLCCLYLLTLTSISTRCRIACDCSTHLGGTCSCSSSGSSDSTSHARQGLCCILVLVVFMMSRV